MRVFLKSPVRENCTPGSVPGQLGNWLSYGDEVGMCRNGGRHPVRGEMYAESMSWIISSGLSLRTFNP